MWSRDPEHRPPSSLYYGFPHLFPKPMHYFVIDKHVIDEVCKICSDTNKSDRRPCTWMLLVIGYSEVFY